jgi:prevent-host-death family protein
MPKTAAVSELKASLSRYLDHVKAGEEVIVTERGRPIARVVPFGPVPDDLEDLYRSGAIIPAKTPGPVPKSFWETRAKLPPGVSLLDALLAEREEDTR